MEFIEELRKKVEEGLRLNTDEYIKLLEDTVKPWALDVANGSPFVWQKDSTPCHTSWRSKMWLAKNFFEYTKGFHTEFSLFEFEYKKLT